jgi:hypothetical protein
LILHDSFNSGGWIDWRDNYHRSYLLAKSQISAKLICDEVVL